MAVCEYRVVRFPNLILEIQFSISHRGVNPGRHAFWDPTLVPLQFDTLSNPIPFKERQIHSLMVNSIPEQQKLSVLGKLSEQQT